MKHTIRELARLKIRTLKPYNSARKIGGNGDIWLNANESPFPTKFNLSLKTFNRYPESQPKEVIERYSNYAKLSSNQILVSRGADEAIELLIRTFCEPSVDTVLFSPPTYGMYAVSAESCGVESIQINPLKGWQINLAAIEQQLNKFKLIYLCNPNNPTGNLLNIEDIRTLLKMTMEQKALVIIDESYIEFCPHASITTWIHDYPNLVILRTLSKAFALAGIRCGFALADQDIINLLLKVIAPYPLSIPVADIATQALSEFGITKMRNNVKKIINNRNWLIQALDNCSCVDKVFDSEANYLLVRFHNAPRVFDHLSKKGIILRDQSDHKGLVDCLRITIGTRKECVLVITALQNLNLKRN
ncbi:MAG: histidinol-phosphate transaminase [Candidatus Dasytiphilus stammeri]